MLTDTLSIARVVRTDPHIRYNEHRIAYRRRRTRVVTVGHVGIGGDNPIRIQSMTTTDTMDTDGTIRQIIQLAEAGCEMVRITAPSIRDAENLRHIRDGLRKVGIRIPLIADIHFTPNAALKAVEFVDKIRINPGNFADKKKFAVVEYSDEAYDRELERIETVFKPLVLKCQEYGVAMRIGTNHGSLSDRIMNRFGDTPTGMVESALEFVRICERYGYHDLVLSMKASNPQVMIAAYRLLAARMYEFHMEYPFHLGVTEAGDGEDGRIKSAIGIGTLLEEGIGDTIRVSLTEDSVHEIPAAQAIAHAYNQMSHEKLSPSFVWPAELREDRHPFEYKRRWSQTVELSPFNLGGVHLVRVEWATPEDSSPADRWSRALELHQATEFRPEIVSFTVRSLSDLTRLERGLKGRDDSSGPAVCVNLSDPGLLFDAMAMSDMVSWMPTRNLGETAWRQSLERALVQVSTSEKKALRFDLASDFVPEFVARQQPELERLAALAAILASAAHEARCTNYVLRVTHPYTVAANRLVAARLHDAGFNPPLSLHAHGRSCAECDVLFQASIALGALLIDGIGDVVSIPDTALDPSDLMRWHYGILQATRLRISKTEFISCPSCGRTLFDLQEVTARIKARTGHLKGVKIAIMGCIVNGPGEMADADFGYVGASAGKINLYVGKELVERNINMSEADDRLVDLIRDKGLWVEPPVSHSTNRERPF